MLGRTNYVDVIDRGVNLEVFGLDNRERLVPKPHALTTPCLASSSTALNRIKCRRYGKTCVFVWPSSSSDVHLVVRITPLHLFAGDERQAAQVPPGHISSKRPPSCSLCVQPFYTPYALPPRSLAVMKLETILTAPQARSDQQADARNLTGGR